MCDRYELWSVVSKWSEQSLQSSKKKLEFYLGDYRWRYDCNDLWTASPNRSDQMEFNY